MLRSLVWLLLPCQAWAIDTASFHPDVPFLHGSFHGPVSPHAHSLRSSNSNGTLPLPELLAGATSEDIQKARVLVAKVNAVQAKCREVTLARNNYKLQPGTVVSARDIEPDPSSQSSGSALSESQEEIAAALALVAEADAVAERSNTTLGSAQPRIKEAVASQASQFWMGAISRKGAWPFGNNPSNFTVYRNVKDFGAKGDGVTDDRKAIQDAIQAGSMCGAGCYSTSTKMAVIYFPPGTYLVSGTIETYYGTQLIGDPNDRPVMMAGKNMGKLGIFSANKYVGDGTCGRDKLDKEWFINTANFYRSIRNFIFDSTKVLDAAQISVLHWQVAQAASLQNVEFRAKAGQKCIFAENGSGGHMSDIVFKNCEYGIYGGNQQFTAMRLKFQNCKTAVRIIWDWGWTWKSISVDGSSTAFMLVSEDGVHRIGSVSLVDTSITNTQTAIMTLPISTTPGDGTTSVVLNNVKLRGVPTLLAQFVNASDPVKSAVGDYSISGGSKDIDTWVLGHLYDGAKRLPDSKFQDEYKVPRNKNLVDSSNPLGLPVLPYFERARPQYEGASVGDFVHTKDVCKGDGVTDDTKCFQDLLMTARGKSIVFVDAGTYIFSDSVTIPPGSRIVGEAWSQLAAFGPKFANANKPIPLIRVGEKGDKGTVEMQDLLFTSKGPTPGVIFIEWNIEASAPGAAAMWDCHVRVGGASGTGLTAKECPALTSGVNANCDGGSMLMHLTSTGSAYVENSWLWVADHDLDDPDWKDDNNVMTQLSVYVARGFLIESTKPTWLYASASEHSVLYQYQFHGAENIVAGTLQTEQAYYQPTPKPPAPFDSAIGVFKNDPTFRCTELEPCDAGWALRVVDSKDITVLGAGFYSWFTTYDQSTCVSGMNCQKIMVQLDGNRGGIVLQNLVTIGATYMLNADGTLIGAKENLAIAEHPMWSYITSFNAGNLTEVYLPPELVCNTDPPSSRTASCIPPCRFILPECDIASTSFVVTTKVTAEVYVGSSTTETTVTTTITVTTARASHNPVTVGTNQTAGDVFNPVTIFPLPPITVNITKPGSQPTSRVIPLLPYPAPEGGQWPPRNGSRPSTPEPWVYHPGNGSSSSSSSSSTTLVPPVVLPKDGRPDRTDGSTTEPGPTTTHSSYTWSWTGSTFPSSTDSTTTTSTSDIPLMTWPPKSITFKPEDEEKDDEDLPCDLWFFFICIRWPKINIKWIHFPGPIPPGRYPWPPPPGVIDPPPGITIEIKPTPTITITRGTDNKWTTPTEEDERKKCNRPSTVYNTVISVTETVYTTSNTRRTSTSTVQSTRFPHIGCDVTASGTSTTATTTATCQGGDIPVPTGVDQFDKLPREKRDDAAVPQAAIDSTNNNTAASLRRRAGGWDGWHMILIPKDPFDVGPLEQLLTTYEYKDQFGRDRKVKDIYTKIWAEHHHGFTGAWFIGEVIPCLYNELQKAQYKDKWRDLIQVQPDDNSTPPGTPPSTPGGSNLPPRSATKANSVQPDEQYDIELRNTTAVTHQLMKRVMLASRSWEMSSVSVPNGHPWEGSALYFDRTQANPYKQYYHSSAGAGQTVYVLEAAGAPWRSHKEFAHNKPTPLAMAVYGGRANDKQPERDHASQVAVRVTGMQLGTAKMAELISITEAFENEEEYDIRILTFLRQLETFVNVLEDVAKKKTGKSSVINISSGTKPINGGPYEYTMDALQVMMTNVLCELDGLGVVVVNSAGNEGKNVNPNEKWPKWLADPSIIRDKKRALSWVHDYQMLRRLSKNMLMVGSVGKGGEDLDYSQDNFDWIRIWAPGYGWGISKSKDDISDVYEDEFTGQPELDKNGNTMPNSGTSFAAPAVAGLVAYFRGVAAADPGSLLAKKLQNPDDVNWLVDKLQRRLMDPPMPNGVSRNRMIWNGQVPPDVNTGKPDLSCLHRGDVAAMSDRQKEFCPEVEDEEFWIKWKWWSKKKPNGPNGGNTSGGGSGGNNPDGTRSGSGISFQPGQPGPQCASRTSSGPAIRTRGALIGPFSMSGTGQCGVSCESDWYCDWWKNGLPPWFYDPLDPNSPYFHRPPTPDPPKPSPTTTASPTTTVQPPSSSKPTTTQAPSPTPTKEPANYDTCAAGLMGRVSESSGGPPSLGEFQFLVTGNPDRKVWRLHCAGPKHMPGYKCDNGYGLDWVRQRDDNPDWLDGTAHVQGGPDIKFRMNRIDNFLPENNKPLDWFDLFSALFGIELGKSGIDITLPGKRGFNVTEDHEEDGIIERRRPQVSTGIVWAGTNCPDFSFNAGHLWDDPWVKKGGFNR